MVRLHRTPSTNLASKQHRRKLSCEAPGDVVKVQADGACTRNWLRVCHVETASSTVDLLLLLASGR